MVAIRSDTLDFLRGATHAEYEAAGFLQETVDNEMVRQISSPSVSGATLDAISMAIDNRMTTGAILISHVGNLLRDAFADVGSGGGHHDVAGGQIPLGIFADYTTDDQQLLDIVERVITDRLSKGLNISEDEES